MKVLATTTILFFFFSGFSQNGCLLLPSGDYPPGCDICFEKEGNNYGYTPDDTISYDFPCGAVENSVWYTLYNRGPGYMDVRIVLSECNLGKGIEAAIYDQDFNRISDCIFVEEQEENTISFFNPDLQSYHLMIDGVSGDECDFKIFNFSIQGDSSTRIYTSPPDANYCIGAEVCFYRGRDFALESYEWSIPPTDSIVSGGIDEEKICVHFKTEGIKSISLKVSHPCSNRNYSDRINVKPGQTLAIDSFTAIYDKLCLDEEIRLEVGWDNDSVLLDWQVPTTHFQRLNGGFLSSNFYEGRILNTGDVTVSVAPLNECGLRTDLNLKTGRDRTEFVSANVCIENCFTVGDSCYYANQSTRTIQVEPSIIGCDSFVRLRLTPLEIFPSPDITCEQINDGILVEWENHSGVDSTIVFVKRDSVATTTDNSYMIKNIPTDLLFDVKIQPIGNCSYLPAEIKCRGTTSTKSRFLNEKILVYPNPTTGNINIETDLKIQEIEIYDTTGRFLQKEKTASFELKNREAGIYFLKIKTSEGVGMKRVLMN